MSVDLEDSIIAGRPFVRRWEVDEKFPRRDSFACSCRYLFRACLDGDSRLAIV